MDRDCNGRMFDCQKERLNLRDFSECPEKIFLSMMDIQSVYGESPKGECWNMNYFPIIGKAQVSLTKVKFLRVIYFFMIV